MSVYMYVNKKKDKDGEKYTCRGGLYVCEFVC